MTTLEHVLSAANAALVSVDAEVERHAKGAGRAGEAAHMQAMRHHLELVRRQLLSGDPAPPENRLRGLGRTITDSWPLDNETGTLIMAAEDAYLGM